MNRFGLPVEEQFQRLERFRKTLSV